MRGSGGAAAAAVLETPPPELAPAPELSQEPMVSEIRVCAHPPRDAEPEPLEHTPPAMSGVRLRVEPVDRDEADSIPPSSGDVAIESGSAPPAPVVALFDVSSPATDVEPVAAVESIAAVDALEDAFFAKAGAASVGSDGGPNDAWFFDDAFDDEPDATRARKASPEAVVRRARFSRFVAWVVGGASLLCAVAVVREASRPASAGALPPSAALEPAVTPASRGVLQPSAGPTSSPPAER